MLMITVKTERSHIKRSASRTAFSPTLSVYPDGNASAIEASPGHTHGAGRRLLRSDQPEPSAPSNQAT